MVSGAKSDSKKSIEALNLQPNNGRSSNKSAEVYKECRTVSDAGRRAYVSR